MARYPQYAAHTKVPIDRSKAEIERTLSRYGADGFSYATTPERSMVAFRFNGRMVRVPITNPSRQDFQHTSTGVLRTEASQEREYDQAMRQRWRALLLIIKAQLEAVRVGVMSADEIWLAWTVLPNNRTVGDWMLPQVERAYETGSMPPMLPGHDEEE